MDSTSSSVKVLPGNPPVELVLRRSARARRMTLRVSSLDGRVSLTRPSFVSEAEAMAFAAEKADWLRKAVGRTVAPRTIAMGVAVPVAGVERPILPGRPGIGEAGVMVRENRPVGPQVAAILREVARARLTEASRRYADRLGVKIGRITLRDTRSRWGSCTARGDLMYSWRLVMAPPDVLDYVAAHEVAHLRHMDHSPAYWRVVESVRPDWRDQRAWLRLHGGTLHAWRFDGD
ncbi:M48 family metallopeptidase [Palleronia abyssalis]|uniref:YgjP-like metallopeptidase domain-containing protein n=1 Tax=Palleronia abyssalis TaxID=1501240 RepID=A0A2R8C1L8_9RHOB|nr:SprT family zinc-dependent metalloprotease [Palleronia abyssalis]SPJ26291.1 hypothetical protein PAA8504_04148 [Palleronia abyssalis]